MMDKENAANIVLKWWRQHCGTSVVGLVDTAMPQRQTMIHEHIEERSGESMWTPGFRQKW